MRDMDVDGTTILKCMLKETGANVWAGFIWHVVGSSCGLLRTREWASEFLERR